MARQPGCSRGSTLASQRGQAIIFTAVLIAIGVLAAIVAAASLTSVSIANRGSENTAKVMLEVKQALISWSVVRDPANDGPNARPGELPCPDINPLDGYDDGTCVAGAIGRVPWKTLGIPEPKDESGETLWYTIAGSFRKYVNSNTPITSDTLGNITVYHDNTSTTLITPASTATTLTSQAVAVIFAPGAALGTQDRSSSTTMTCTAPSGTYARNQCASNYLETWSSVNNATINGPFIQAKSSDNFNDRLLAITNADLMPLVEQRVAREMIAYLNSYRSTTGIYPWADLGDGNSNGALGTFAYNRNRFPCGTALPYNWGRSTSPVTPSLPNWLTNGCNASLTGWVKMIFYTVAKNRLQNSGSGCAPWPNCTSSTLSITNSGSLVATQCDTSSPPTCVSTAISSGSADLLLMTPGAWDGTTSLNWPTSGWTAISGYFDDSENSDNDDDNYVVPTSTSYNRDRIYIVR